MKKLLLSLAIIALATSCEDSKDQILDPTASVYIVPAPGTKTATTNPDHLSALEIVKQADIIYGFNPDVNTTDPWSIGIGDDNRDIVNVRLITPSSFVIGQDGSLSDMLIKSSDVIIATLDNDNQPIDTIGYIPRAVMANAETEITKAYNEKRYADCYELFDTAFTFLPTTGAEYKAMQEAGTN